MKYVITTAWDNAKTTAGLIEETFEGSGARAIATPYGFRGVVLLEADEPLPREALVELPETSRVVPVLEEVEPVDLEALGQACARVARELPAGSSFAVRATRRGDLGFSSEDIERVGGARIVRSELELEVDLDEPDHVVRVETMREWAGVGVLDGASERAKHAAKPDARWLTGKLNIVQLAYESEDPRGTTRIGSSIGRAAQAFEVPRLIVVIDRLTSADRLRRFLEAVDDGIGSRHRIQQRTYAHDPERVTVKVHELHQLLRRIAQDAAVVIMTDPRGEALEAVGDQLAEDIRDADAVYLFNGANRGLPPGCFSSADHVVDLAPGITYGTDQAITAAVPALLNL